MNVEFVCGSSTPDFMEECVVGSNTVFIFSNVLIGALSFFVSGM